LYTDWCTAKGEKYQKRLKNDEVQVNNDETVMTGQQCAD